MNEDFTNALFSSGVSFGLKQQGHLTKIKKMLNSGANWKEIGEEISWCHETAKRHYLYHFFEDKDTIDLNQLSLGSPEYAQMDKRKIVEKELLNLCSTAVFFDNLDDAIFGIGRRSENKRFVVAYKKSKCIECFKKEMSHNDAVEWFEYNVLDAYVGEYTPIFI
jgi:hypothetical protein